MEDYFPCFFLVIDKKLIQVIAIRRNCRYDWFWIDCIDRVIVDCLRRVFSRISRLIVRLMIVL